MSGGGDREQPRDTRALGRAMRRDSGVWPYRGDVVGTWDNARPLRAQRILVAGTSGSGKTTVAARLAPVLDVPHIEIDALFHGPDWTERPQFAAEVDAFSRQERWITEWQYAAVRDLLAERADLLVWLDLPRARVMSQVIARTVRRRLAQRELWNKNFEAALWTVFRDRDHIVRWAWRTHAESAERVAALGRRRPDLPIVRLRSRRQVRRWLQQVDDSQV